MILDEVLAFLERTPPFQFLDKETLRRVVNSLTLEFYPKGTVILKQNGPASDALRIIKKGSVKLSVRSDSGEDMVIDYRGEGDNFGIISLMSKDRQRTTITAAEDTICYLLNKEQVYRLIDASPAFTEHVLQYHFTKYIDKAYREMHAKSLFVGSSDHLLFTTPVGDIATRGVATIGRDATIRDAAAAMSRDRISSIIIVDDQGRPDGIVTDRDLREKVVSRGRSVDGPARGIMSLPLVFVDAHELCFEAVLRMIKHNIHHVPVMRDGRLDGMLTNHDLMLLQGTSPLSLSRDIEGQQTFEGLVPASGKINGIIGLLIKEGARAGNIAKILTEINDRLVRKVLEFAERSFGAPPVPYCWVALGSAGRREQVFRTGQDHAVIHADPVSEQEAAEARRYFAAFTVQVRDHLAQVGFPEGAAGYLASDPRWSLPLGEWKRTVSAWVAAPTRETLAHARVLADLRPVHGAFLLADELRGHFTAAVRGRKEFLGLLAKQAVRSTPPIGFLKSFVVEKGGGHKDELDLKARGIMPLVEIVRLFSLEQGVQATSTLDRIEALTGSHAIMRKYHDELLHAFEFIMQLRIHRRFEALTAGGPVTDFINPDRLSSLEKRSLKDAFQLITRVQNETAERNPAMAW